MKLGTIKEIWRYPVKGMAGESVERCGIGAWGLEGDRVWALRDTAREEIQSCKFRPELLLCNASSRSGEDDGHVDVQFPGGDTLGSDDAAIHDRLSALVGQESTLEMLRPLEELNFYRRYKRGEQTWLEELKATFAREPGEPYPDLEGMPQQGQDFVTIPGTFFLVSPLHIVTTATMEHLKGLLPGADWDMRRFRPNIVIETVTDDGLVEQGWLGKQIVIGEALVECAETAPRCGAVTRRQRDFEFDASMLRTIVTEADQNLGIYGNFRRAGTLRVGDPVYAA